MQDLSYRDINKEVLRTLFRPGRVYYSMLAISFLGVLAMAACFAYQINRGLGVAGYLHPVMWGVYLVNFVFWIGIGHSGTLISAILYLFRASWRTAIARSAEAMTVFSVIIASLFPAFIHLGRPWLFYWVFPYPNQRFLWIDFQSPLVFDVCAVTTYLTVSSLFWYVGMIPDLAIVRDNTTGWRSKLYGFFSLGWLGAHNQWRHFTGAYLFFAALATPLVVSVHSVVSWDFALAIIPGYHSTIFPPYFVAGAIHSGLAMVLTLLIPLRRIFKFEQFIDMKTLENVAKTLLVTCLIVGYSYLVEQFMSWYSGNRFERDIFMWRVFGNYGASFWIIVICNAVAPLVLFIKKMRTNLVSLFVVAILVDIGMWLERFVIIIGSMAHDFDPYNWGIYAPTWVEITITAGSVCMFFFFFLLFAKFLPSISITEIKESLKKPRQGAQGPSEMKKNKLPLEP
jgi:Ni/Fe-hydrogenase subunit HybB-like protein